MAATPTATTDTLDPKDLLQILTAFKKGDFSVRMPIEYTGGQDRRHPERDHRS